MSVNYGSKRTVVGAHYGTRDFLAQRSTAVLMALYTVVLLVRFLTAGPVGYESWAGIFAPQWMKFLTLALFVALGWHAWIGVRDIWMDYVKPLGLRLALHLITLFLLVGYAGWAAKILWRL